MMPDKFDYDIKMTMREISTRFDIGTGKTGSLNSAQIQVGWALITKQVLEYAATSWRRSGFLLPALKVFRLGIQSFRKGSIMS